MSTPIQPETPVADGRPTIRCGCGFVAVSDSAIQNRAAYDRSWT